MTAATAAVTVFVAVGTDHHPFDRLIRWVDAWMNGWAGDAVCSMQVGTSIAPKHGEYEPYLTYLDMERRMRDADVVVCHGGPGTIASAWWVGRRPIVVPRMSELGEHVDDHQVLFTRHLVASGDIALAEDEDVFERLVSLAATDPAVGSMEPRSTRDQSAAVERFASLVDPLLGRAASRRGPA